MENLLTNQFIVDFDFMDKGILMNNVIKVPITFAAEIVKFYPEHQKRMFMPYDEIREGINWHNKYMPKIPITENHINMYDESNNLIIPNPDLVIGYVQDLKADDEKRVGKGWAYIKKNKINEFLLDYLRKGNIVGTSVGGYAQELGPGGYFHEDKYDHSQMKLRFHHIALVTHGLPRCPPNICGFNVKDSFEDAKYPWNKCIQDRLKEGKSKDSAERICGWIKKKYGDLQAFSESFLDSSNLKTCVSNKIEYLYNEYRSKDKPVNRDQIVAHAYSHCRKKMGLKDSIDYSSEKPEYDFFLLHQYLIDGNYLSRNSCVLNFYSEMKNEWNDSENIEIIKDGNKHIIITSNLKKNDVSKMDIEELKKIIADLKAENEQLKAEKIEDAQAEIKTLRTEIGELRKANQEFADANDKLNKVVAQIQTEKIKTMQKTLLDSKKYSVEEIRAMDFNMLSTVYDAVIRISGNNSTILRPNQSQTSILPMANATGIGISDQNQPKPRQYRIGTPPPMDVILDEKHDHWIPRYPKKEQEGF